MVESTQTEHEKIYSEVMTLLSNVKDPEIPTISIVDLGMVTKVIVDEETRRIDITMTPTFVGCPALDYIRRDVEHNLAELEGYTSHLVVDFSIPWSSNRISDAGREALRKHGLGLPPRFEGEFEPEIMLNANCPHCGSTNTKLRSAFGPTLCRAFYDCQTCHQAFEQFKPA